LEGKLYLAVLVDGCSRLAVGHAIGEHADAALAMGALELAVGRRGPPCQPLVRRLPY
jgi:transposase InsO family protein